MATAENMRIWFRHSGQPPVSWSDVWRADTKLYTTAKVKREVWSYDITDLKLEGKIPSNIGEIADKALCLRVSKLTDRASLDNLCQLTQLEELDMGGNPLKTVPKVVSSLTSLKELNMIMCELSDLPESLCQLTQLEKLHIGLNPLNTVPEVVSSFTSLKELDMGSCELSTLPESLCQLTQLEKLYIGWNPLNTVPEVVSSLTSLKELNMGSCKLSTLPERIERLQKLWELKISENKFSSLPSSVCALNNLYTLNISYNNSMTSLNPEILQLTHLRYFHTYGCDALTSPPQEVCERGLDAVRQYYTDLAKGAGRNLPFATIVVLGNTMAGKTSLIRTLQSTDKKRVLTGRSPNAEYDETTKVFNVEEVEVDGTTLRLIDMGGQEVYHITYHLTLKQNCVPVIVVNMEQYDRILKTSTDREAVRKLAFDFMSHLYLAHPTLGPPNLVFTHKDKFPSEVFQQLRRKFLEVSEQFCKYILEEEKSLEGKFARIQHFTESNGKVFPNDNIYEVGKFDEYKIFESIKKSLLQSCQHFVKPLPKVWEDANNNILSLQTPHNTFDEVLAVMNKKQDNIEAKQLDTIIMYMHDCGKVLWYKHIIALRPYIFHKITEVTKLLCVLYHHDPDVWQSRVDQFKPYCCREGVRIEEQEFKEFVNSFRINGLMTKSLLEYLIRKETSFTGDNDVKIAVCLLRTFRLLYGPLNNDSEESYFIVPQFAKESYSLSYTPPKELLLHTETQFNGLALPQHVYHQMTVGLLELFADDSATIQVKRNGANVYQDKIYTQLIHDYESRRVLLYTSSDANNITKAWEKLISVNNNILRHVMETWTASRPVTACICAHCLLLGVPCPKKSFHPKWCFRSLKKPSPAVKKCSGSATLLCNKEEIPRALTFPCEALSERETDEMVKLLTQLKLRRQQNDATRIDDDDLSDLSEDDDNLYPDGENEEDVNLIQPNLKTTRNLRIKYLFSNAEKVFKMTRNRGKALIINNKNFNQRPDLCREGSDADVDKMSFMLKSLKFAVETHTDLKAEEMLSAVKSEIKREKNNGLGCQILVIMTHGGEDNSIYGTDLEKVNLTDLYEFLAPLSLKPKPTVVILESCSGVTIKVNPDRSGFAAAQEEETEAVSSTHSEADDDIVYPETPSVIRPIRPVFLPEYRIEEHMTRLDVDNLLVLKSNVCSSKRHPEYGSPMIRALVSSIYKHACHRDLYTIFQQVQTKLVKKLYADEDSERSRNLIVIWNTLLPRKRLYLFPGFDGFGEEAKS